MNSKEQIEFCVANTKKECLQISNLKQKLDLRAKLHPVVL